MPNRMINGTPVGAHRRQDGKLVPARTSFKGARALVKTWKRDEAEARNAQTPIERRRATRRLNVA